MLTILCSICIRSALVACPVRGLAAIRGFGLLVLDNNGYVVISKEERDVSRFFGEIDLLVMNPLTHYGFFEKVKDLQKPN